MSEKSEHIAGAFLVGSFLPVLVVVWLGLMNEGFSSLSFLFYPGVETWLQLALIGVFLLLLAASLPVLGRRAIRGTRGALAPMLVAGIVGVALASAVLYLIGIGETPWRKFYTYVVAPRALSVWLLCAVLGLLVFVKMYAREHAT